MIMKCVKSLLRIMHTEIICFLSACVALTRIEYCLKILRAATSHGVFCVISFLLTYYN